VELYDHLVDPGENINIALERKEVADSLVTVLKTVKFMDEDMPFLTGWE
jgi:hypothetical protein